jgi:GNAT superfamily N-acetyltransferase
VDTLKVATPFADGRADVKTSKPRTVIDHTLRPEISAVEHHNRVVIETLSESQLPDVAQILSLAFRDNPLHTAVVGSDADARLRSSLHGLSVLLPVALRHGVLRGAFRDTRVVGASLLLPPLAYPLPPATLAARLRCLFGQGWRVSAAWRRVFHFLDSFHLAEPHWYLSTLGIDPACQKEGIGAALLSDFIALADRDAVPAYLETDRPEIAPFYARQGFETIERTEIMGVPIWHMLRPPTTP